MGRLITAQETSQERQKLSVGFFKRAILKFVGHKNPTVYRNARWKLRLKAETRLLLKLDIGCGANKIRPDYLGLGPARSPDVDIIGSGTHLPFKTGSLDCIYSRRVIQHIENHNLVFSEISRTLKEDGSLTLILATWRGYLFYKLRWLFRKKPYKIFHFYTVKKLLKLLEENKIHTDSILKVPTRSVGKDFWIYARVGRFRSGNYAR